MNDDDEHDYEIAHPFLAPNVGKVYIKTIGDDGEPHYRLIYDSDDEDKCPHCGGEL